MRPRRACGFAVLFLQEQVRDLRIQEFLRELIVGAAAHNDLVGSILVKILHSDEGGDVEQVTRTSKQISRVCDCSSLSQLTCVYILHTYYICAHPLHLDIAYAS